MTDHPLMLWRWTGTAMEPLPRFAKTADEAFVVGEVYRQETIEERSLKSHNHYFAALTEAWRNLPEDQAERFPSVEALRKWGLIQAGYCNTQTVVCASKAEALRLPVIVTGLDQYAIVTVRAAVVTIYTAQSQSMRAMGAGAFQESKTAVLDIIAGILGVTADELSKARAA